MTRRNRTKAPPVVDGPNEGRALSRCIDGTVPREVIVHATAAAELTIEGLTDAAAREARVRVASSLAHLGHVGLGARVLVAGVVGRTPHLDVAIAVAVLRAHGKPLRELPAVLIGELALDGTVRAVRGASVLLAGVESALVPYENRMEVSYLDGQHEAARAIDDLLPLPTVPAKDRQAGERCGLVIPIVRRMARPVADRPSDAPRGICLVGKPGSGTTLIARQIWQALAFEPSPDVDAVYSVAGMLPNEGTVTRAPFRSPHHTVSDAGLVGAKDRPGEASLAHRGVLFLDDLAEFRKSALDALFHTLGRGEAPSGFAARPAMVIAAGEDSPRLRSFMQTYKLAPVPIEHGFLFAHVMGRPGNDR